MKERGKSGLYEFDSFRLDAGERVLWRAGKPVALTPKEFELLLALVENAGRIVSKDELLEGIWKNTFVEEGTLTRNISWLRKKLATEDATATVFIETLPKRGYRFLPTVTKIEDAPARIIEDQTLTRIRIEETITVETPGETTKNVNENSPRALAPAPQNAGRSGWLWLALGVATAASVAAICVALYQNFFRKVEPKIVVLSPATPFSGLPGRENFPAFSPDGKQLTFVWNGGDAENFDVYMRLIGAGEPVRLTHTQEDEIHPTFSPDGSHVAFVRPYARGSAVFLVPALGGAERKICDLIPTYSRLSFTPDGKRLAITDAEENDNREGIFLVDVTTGAKRRLTVPPESAKDFAARISPDGSQVAFLRAFGEAYYELFVMPLVGGAWRQLTFNKTGIAGLTWNAAGDKIIYPATTTDQATNLWQISPAGDDAPERIAINAKNITNPAVSVDGRTLAFIEGTYETNIWRIASDSSARKLIASNRDEHSPVIAPDGNRIAFVSNRTGTNQVWIADPDGKNQRQLTGINTAPVSLAAQTRERQTPTETPAPAAGSPRFSPDNRFVAYDSQVNGNGEIFVVSVEGGAPRRFTTDAAQDILPAWSHDGRFIYFCSNRGGSYEIWKMASEGSAAVQVTKHGGFESALTFDGKEIFYTKERGDGRLWRASLESGEESLVPELAEAGSWRYWTITRTGIYFVPRASSAPYRIKFYDFASRAVREVATTKNSPIWVYPGLSASADGTRILYAQHDQNASSIMLAEF